MHPHRKFDIGIKSPTCCPELLNTIFLVNENVTLLIDAQFCFKHYKETESKKKNTTVNNKLAVLQKCSMPKKEAFEPEKICISEEISDKA